MCNQANAIFVHVDNQMKLLKTDLDFNSIRALCNKQKFALKNALAKTCQRFTSRLSILILSLSDLHIHACTRMHTPDNLVSSFNMRARALGARPRSAPR